MLHKCFASPKPEVFSLTGIDKKCLSTENECRKRSGKRVVVWFRMFSESSILCFLFNQNVNLQRQKNLNCCAFAVIPPVLFLRGFHRDREYSLQLEFKVKCLMPTDCRKKLNCSSSHMFMHEWIFHATWADLCVTKWSCECFSVFVRFVF